MYDRALELKPDNPEAWLRRGLALKELSRYEGTIAALNKVLRIQPEHTEAWFYRGVTLNRLVMLPKKKCAWR